MVCPAISDPFRGRFWRVAAAVHQSVYIPLHAKSYTLFSQLVLEAYSGYGWELPTPPAHPKREWENEQNGDVRSMWNGMGKRNDVKCGIEAQLQRNGLAQVLKNSSKVD